ncbi:fimbrial protein [Pseudomonas sp.]|uniref:fimbrial protein n=1 Tax=Pseudomonas sp. TaxID=306 RepID=UPI00261B20B4|nr:fimbrial protein [Pseudomonas sp.]
MKHSIKRVTTLLALSLPMAAHAACDIYMNSTHGLTLPSTITVPANLPVGGEILRKTFDGVAPANFMNCPTGTPVAIRTRDYAALPNYISATEAPGIGIVLYITDARPSTNRYAFISFNQALPAGRHPFFTSAEAVFYKTGPVTGGTIPSGTLFEYLMNSTGGPGTGRFNLRLDSPVRFVSPAATCDLAAGDVNRTISLDPVKVSDFESAVYTGSRHFELTANCSEASNVTFRFSGTPAPGNGLLFANTGSADGIGLWLYSVIGGNVQTITPQGSDGERTLVVSADRAVLPLGAAYHKNGTVTQGTLASTATVSITYN